MRILLTPSSINPGFNCRKFDNKITFLHDSVQTSFTQERKKERNDVYSLHTGSRIDSTATRSEYAICAASAISAHPSSHRCLESSFSIFNTSHLAFKTAVCFRQPSFLPKRPSLDTKPDVTFEFLLLLRIPGEELSGACWVVINTWISGAFISRCVMSKSKLLDSSSAERNLCSSSSPIFTESESSSTGTHGDIPELVSLDFFAVSSQRIRIGYKLEYHRRKY